MSQHTEEQTDSDLLGARIREARKRARLDLRTLAGRLSISIATLSAIETGRSGVSALRLAQLARVLDVPIGSFFEERRKPFSNVAPVDGNWRKFAPLPFDDVLLAALEAFKEYGYHGSNMRDIARRANLTGPGVYHYYSSKQQMLVVIIRYIMSDLLKRFEAARSEGKDPVSRFTLLIECSALFHASRPDLGFVGASELRSLEDEAATEIAEMRIKLRRMVDQEVEEATVTGDFVCANPRHASRAAVTLCTAIPQWYTGGGTMTPEDVAIEYVSFALGIVGYAAISAKR